MLKQVEEDFVKFMNLPAAFRRLCVETILEQMSYGSQIPAAFRRLCVETGTIAKIARNLASSRL